MPITIRPSVVKIKKPSTGEYREINALLDTDSAKTVYYGVSSTAADTQTKTVAIEGITELSDGLLVRVLFANAQSYSGTPKLQINSTTASNIKWTTGADAETLVWEAGEVLDFVYVSSANGFVVLDRKAINDLNSAISDLNGAINAITPLDTAPTSGSTKGITSGAVYTAEHTVTQPTVSRGNDIIGGTNLVLNDCRKFQKVVTYRAQLESKTSSEVTYPHNTVMFTGLPHPYQNIIFMANTFLENKSDQHQYRLVLTTDGDIKTYWDTAHVPKTGSAFLVDITYLTSE